MTEEIPAEPSLLKFQPAFGHGLTGLCNTERLPAVPVPPFFSIAMSQRLNLRELSNVVSQYIEVEEVTSSTGALRNHPLLLWILGGGEAALQRERAF